MHLVCAEHVACRSMKNTDASLCTNCFSMCIFNESLHEQFMVSLSVKPSNGGKVIVPFLLRAIVKIVFVVLTVSLICVVHCFSI
jgi:hypothetical protein